MSTYNEVVYWLTLINESELKLSLLKPIIQRWCITDNRSLAEIFTLSPLELTTTFGLSDQDAAQIIEAPQKLAAQAEALAQWKQQGIEPIIRIDPNFPKRLINTLSPAKQPLVLWGQGNAELLNLPSVTMLGHQEPDKSTKDFVDQLMAALVMEEIGLVSGYGRGLDRITFESMLTKDQGFTIAVLPMGLSAFAQTTNKLQDAVQNGRTLLISPFSPDMAYNDRLAEARNILIDHLSMALLIPESDDDSQARAIAALERGLPVFVKANTPSNRELLDHGALLLTDAGEVLEWVQQALVDAAIQEEDANLDAGEFVSAPLSSTALPPLAPSSDEDFKLRVDEVSPIDSEEALEVLSLGGEIPEILRQRLKKPRSNPK